ncbi:hypothetical protein RND71_032161 [Anisodus tanguticus]|uniref:Uncharacterized protein n=1 Tax=Anisodus tanguticus TaxID=243964 RepID=A0AAE1V3Y6_9SOLA|nr:hypothetical protein RND71_032161 [Anisodus tanguticus]
MLLDLQEENVIYLSTTLDAYCLEGKSELQPGYEEFEYEKCEDENQNVEQYDEDENQDAKQYNEDDNQNAAQY